MSDEDDLCPSCEQDEDDCTCVECNSCGETVESTYMGICQDCEDDQTINSLRYQ